MRFNFSFRKNKPAPVLNHEGALAYQLTPALELYAAVATAALSDQFYETAGTRLQRLRELVRQNDPRFVAQLAVYAREQLYLRSVPLVLAVELAQVHRGDVLVSRLVARVVQRADEITELLAFYAVANQRQGPKTLNRLSKQLQKGLALAFNRFDGYQLAKYDRAGQVRLRDALFLVHPQAKSAAQQALFDQLVRGELPTPYTWETELSALGQQQFASAAERQTAFRRKWETLIGSDKLGYMALLRNLRNILEADVSAAAVEQVVAALTDAGAVARSKQLPFRYLAAYRELLPLRSGYTALVLQALETAIGHSIQNLRGFGAETRVVVACDVSGSMQQPVSQRSKVLLYDVGLVLGMLLQSRCGHVVTGMFGDTWKRVALPKGQVLRNVQEFYRREGEVGYSTNGYLVVQDLRQRREVADKVMIFTDCQLWDSTGQGTTLAQEWREYRRTVAPQARLYLFDLAGHGNVPVQVKPENGVALIAGWSDKVFDVLQALENGGSALTEIEKIEL
ncbi:TROVE domain-containing protein [Hymenobacter busanensis]|uniref:TROVE domain-containing protein n=1 Tax=Hymenobacter busanensis TaxID=2607656 RepID=A0A7L4ZSG7_9BACT|nr:TROVE domain-containing protein [Hymenobacter busanensis]KAA9327630.1 TROVE domain-containing protein [Hymenobacter busanensis]QHJ06031.1 TROVE domain-containing protein [Hymenobacter busanensis]